MIFFKKPKIQNSVRNASKNFIGKSSGNSFRNTLKVSNYVRFLKKSKASSRYSLKNFSKNVFKNYLMLIFMDSCNYGRDYFRTRHGIHLEVRWMPSEVNSQNNKIIWKTLLKCLEYFTGIFLETILLILFSKFFNSAEHARGAVAAVWRRVLKN